MPSDGVPAATGMRRLHPTSLIFSIGSAARRLLLPGIILLLAASRSRTGLEIWAMVFFAPALVVAVIRYLSYRYRLGHEELVIREGIVNRNERHIPYHRIQNIDLVQNPLHRWLHVAEVRLETAGGEKPEAVIRVLALADVEQMRARVFAERSGGAPLGEAAEGEAAARETAPPAPARQLLVMPPREVALFGIISNQGMVVVAAVLGLLWQLDLFERWVDSLSIDSVKDLPEIKPGVGPWTASLLALGALVLFLVLLRLLSIAWAFLKLHGFKLTRRADDLRAEYGLLTRISKTVPRQRIQVVSSRSTLLHRWFHRAAVQVETAGSAGEESDSRAARTWLAPLVRLEELGRLFAEALPGLDLDGVRWQPLSPRAFRRVLRRSLLLAILPVAGATATCLNFGIVAVAVAGVASVALAVAWAWLHARLYVRHTGYALTADTVLHRSGWWVRRISAARFSKIQAAELVESPFDRRRQMASLRLDTAGAGPLGQRIAVAYLDRSTAEGLHERLSHEAGRTTFRW
jgi:putative membrane protein